MRRIGIAVRGDDVAIMVGARRGALLSIPAPKRADETSWGAYWHQILGAIPPMHLRNAEVTVALDHGRFRARRMFGVALESSADEVDDLCRTALDSFFIAATGALRPSVPERREDGWWCAVVDDSDVAAILSACAAVGVRLSGIIGHGASDTAPIEEAAAAAVEARTDRGLVLDPLREERRRRLSRRAGASVLAIVTGLLVAIAFGPSMILSLRAARMERRVLEEEQSAAALGVRAAEAEELLAIDRMLARRAADDRPVTVWLSSLASALPESTVIRSLSFDSAMVRISVLAPASRSIVTGLPSVRGLQAPQISGPLTLESDEAGTWQRATLVFSRSEAASTSRTARGVQ